MGLGAGLAGFGDKEVFGAAQVGFASPWLSPSRRVFGEAERLRTPSSSHEANHVSQLVSKRCPRGVRLGVPEPCLASAIIQDFRSWPLMPFDPFLLLQGAVLLRFYPWKRSVLDRRVGFQPAGSAFGIFQPVPFPSSFANPKSLSLGCSSLLSDAVFGTQRSAL